MGFPVSQTRQVTIHARRVTHGWLYTTKGTLARAFEAGRCGSRDVRDENHQLLNIIMLTLTQTWVAQVIAALPPARSEGRSTPHWLPDTS